MKKINIDYMELKELYVNKGLNLKECGYNFNCSDMTILNKLREYNFHIRSISESHLGKKRKPFSEEHKRNMSEVQKGKIIPIETREKMSEAMRGENNPNYGKHPSEETRQRMSEAQSGSKKSLSTKQKMSESRRGEKNNMYGRRDEKAPNWKGGISFEPYPITFNRELKGLIRQRDGYQCQLCRMPECENINKLDVHHIDYNKKNCLPSNLISLCKRCNAKVNYNREYWEEYFERHLI